MIFRKIKAVHIPGRKEMSIKDEILNFTNPEKVYVPLVEQGTMAQCLVKAGDKVRVGQVIAEKGGRFPIPIHSPISGEVISINQKMWNPSGKMVETIAIQNDFQETKIESIKPRDTDFLTREEIVEIVKNCGVVGLGGSGFPTYVKYQTTSPIDVVIINAAECEPYITADYMLMKTRATELIDGIKFIMRATDAPRAVIAIKKTKPEIIEILNNHLAEEENISVFLLPDVYPAGWEKYIVHKVVKKTYASLPSEVGAVVNNVATAIAVNNAVKYNMPLIEKVVTLTGEGLNDPQNVYVKIGTEIRELLPQIGGYNGDIEQAYLIAGGPMTGKAIVFDTLVVNRCLGSVIVREKDIRVVNPECMGCGKCCDICPVNLSPILIKNALEDKDVDLLQEFRADKCIECGLCSFICPSRIELTDAVARAKATVLKR